MRKSFEIFGSIFIYIKVGYNLQIRYCVEKKLHESKLQDFFYYLIATRFEFASSSSSMVAQEVWSKA